MALTKAILAQKLTDEIGLNKRESKEFIEVFFNELNNTLASGDEVKLSSFGNFIIRDKNERMSQNILVCPAFYGSGLRFVVR